MSEIQEKTGGLKFLPLFPLPLVLLPHELLPLHIFEPRYRKMIDDIHSEKNLFGLSYFDPEKTDLSLPAIGSVGCVAEVREIQALPDGRSNILTVGVTRYRLEGYDEAAGEPYLVGEVSVFEDDEEDPQILEPLAGEVLELFMRVASAAQELAGERGQQRRRLPDLSKARPQELSFLIAAAFNFTPDLKYELLSTRSTIKRLESLRGKIRESVKNIEESAHITKIAKTNGHAAKDIDI